jgi:hypothetical protein
MNSKELLVQYSSLDCDKFLPLCIFHQIWMFSPNTDPKIADVMRLCLSMVVVVLYSSIHSYR